MLVGRWWVEHGLEKDRWRAGRKVQQDPRPQQHRLDCTSQERSNDDHGAAEMGRER